MIALLRVTAASADSGPPALGDLLDHAGDHRDGGHHDRFAAADPKGCKGAAGACCSRSRYISAQGPSFRDGIDLIDLRSLKKERTFFAYDFHVGGSHETHHPSG